MDSDLAFWEAMGDAWRQAQVVPEGAVVVFHTKTVREHPWYDLLLGALPPGAVVRLSLLDHVDAAR